MEEKKLTEDQLQASFFLAVWNQYPQTRRLIWAVPNSAIGAIRTLEQQIRANVLKSTGLLAGVWDLHFFWHNQLHIIETKLPGQMLTIDRVDSKGKKHYGQKEWGELMASHGAIRHIYHYLEDGLEIIEEIVNPKHN